MLYQKLSVGAATFCRIIHFWLETRLNHDYTAYSIERSMDHVLAKTYTLPSLAAEYAMHKSFRLSIPETNSVPPFGT